MEKLKVVIIINSPAAITSKKGEMLYDVLRQYIDEQNAVILSFEGLESCTTGFINTSIGKLYMDFGTEKVSPIVKIEDVEFDVWNDKINRSIELGTQDMVLPPCHHMFEVYTRELSFHERMNLVSGDEIDDKIIIHYCENPSDEFDKGMIESMFIKYDIPQRAISLKWHQRSVDVPLGLPFNIASYGLLLELLALECNMIPEQLNGSLTNVHIYENQIPMMNDIIAPIFDYQKTWEKVAVIYDTHDVEYDNEINPENIRSLEVDIPIEELEEICDELGITPIMCEDFDLPSLDISEAFKRKIKELGLLKVLDNLESNKLTAIEREVEYSFLNRLSEQERIELHPNMTDLDVHLEMNMQNIRRYSINVKNYKSGPKIDIPLSN